MVVSLDNIPKNSQVYRFITSGKPGRCSLCSRMVEKLEAHHISYEPEIVIKVCHNCHHKIHFWPQRLGETDKLKLLTKKFGTESAVRILNINLLNNKNISRLVAPSRNSFIMKERIKLEKAQAQAEKSVKGKVFKSVDLSFIKRVKAPKPVKAVK